MRNKFKVLRQLDGMDCGPTCLKMIFNYYGLRVSRDKLRAESEISKKGVSLLGVSKVAESYGFNTVAARVTVDQLIYDAQLPCLIHWDNYHLVVLVEIRRKRKFVVADPANGKLTFTSDQFSDHFIKAESSGNLTQPPKGIALFMKPGSRFHSIDKDQDDQKQGLEWNLLLGYLLNHKAQLFQLALGMILGSLLQAIFPYLTQSIVDVGINSNDLGFIQLILIAQFVLFFAQIGINFIRSRILLFLSTHLNLTILSDFWIKLLNLPLAFFETRLTGDLMQRISDHNRIEKFITGTVIQTVFSLFNFLVFAVILITYNTYIFAVFAISSLIYLIWISAFLKFRKKIDITKFSKSSKENSMTIQLLEGIRDIKLFNAEQLKRWEWEKIQSSLFRLNFKSLTV